MYGQEARKRTTGDIISIHVFCHFVLDAFTATAGHCPASFVFGDYFGIRSAITSVRNAFAKEMNTRDRRDS
jgi:hypothetical protein